MQEHHTNVTTDLQVPDRNPKTNELNEAWNEVGTQFQRLGSRLAAAFERSWAASDCQSGSTEAMSNLRDDLREAANRIDRAIRDASLETRADQVTTIRATRRASEQSLEEARILTAATLRKLNRQLDHLVERMEENERSKS